MTAINNFSTVPARDIELKVQSVNKGGVILCPYVSKRFVIKALNNKYGETGWKVLRTQDGRMASISIKDKDTNEWVDKGYDIGTASEFESEKGLLTDALKRAASLLGIANSLATSPNLFIRKDFANILVDDKGKGKCYDKFRVLDIRYDEDECISYIRILNESTGRICYEWQDIYRPQPTQPQQAPQDTPGASESSQNTVGSTDAHKATENAAQSPTERQTGQQTMTPPPEPAKQTNAEQYRTYTSHKDELRDMLNKRKINLDWFCEKMNLNRFKDISESKARKCCDEINKIEENWNRDKDFYVNETEVPFA